MAQVKALKIRASQPIAWKHRRGIGTHAPQYKYRPLGARHFRILLLEPGRHDDDLSAELQHVSLDGGLIPPYRTTSYAWGNPTRRSRMLIDSKSMSISESASSLLRHIRQEHSMCMIWVDAICIDQSNIEERSRQVSLMADIYSQGSANIVFLGESDRKTAAALQAVAAIKTEIQEQSRDTSNIGRLMYTGSAGEPRHKAHEPSCSRYDIEDLHSLYRRPWFSRLWVIQEAVLSPVSICICGEHTVLLFDLLAAAAHVIRSHELIYRYREAFKLADYLFFLIYRGYPDDVRRLMVRQDLSGLLYISRRFAVSVPQDSVFALLGLLPPGLVADTPQLRDLLEPDYSKSIAKVLTDASRAALTLGAPGLLLLGFIDHKDQSSVTGQKLPSWVLDLHDSRLSTEMASRLGPKYYAGRHSPSQNLSQTSSDTLAIKGLSLDQVLTVGPIYGRATEPRHFVQSSAHVAGCLLLNNARGKNLQHFARTLVANSVRDMRTPKSMQDLLLAWLDSDESDMSNDDALMQYREAMVRACVMRRIFRTRSGMVGLGPQHMQEGDEIVIFYKSWWPSVVRLAGDGRCYHFVGSCYVDGMMDGQAFQQRGIHPDRHRILQLR
jgi:hypothetical protein